MGPVEASELKQIEEQVKERILKLSRAFDITVSRAAELYDKCMTLRQNPDMTCVGCQMVVAEIMDKPIDKLSPEEARIGVLAGKLRMKQQPLSSFTSDTGRNGRCPCGSGKKYKRCCLDSHLRAGSAMLAYRRAHI